MQSTETLVAIFHQKGLKITPQRRAIFDLLNSADSHLTAEEIYQQLLPQLPDISRTTIYNTLNELVDLGELTVVEGVDGDGVRYDKRVTHHHHLFCMVCHQLMDVDHDFNGIGLSADEAAGYDIIKAQVTFYGYCPNCKKEKVLPNGRNE